LHLRRWAQTGLTQIKGLGGNNNASPLFFIPFNEGFDYGEKIWNSFVLADEAIYVAHYFGTVPE